MSRKKPAPQRPVATKSSRANSLTQMRAPWWMSLVVFILPVLLYLNTMSSDYAVDDDIVIVKNNFTQQGLEGIGDIFSHDAFDGANFLSKDILGPGRYRPLSIATFAVEYEFVGGLNPHVSHFINVLLFGFTVLLLFRFLSLLLSNYASPWKLMVPFVSALLFAAHPVHVEAVANIKGRDEILALLFSLLAMICALRFVRTGAPKWLILIGPMFLLALLAKESAYPLVGVVVLAAPFMKKPSRPDRTAGGSAVGRKGSLLLATGAFVLAAGIGFAIRAEVVGVSFDESDELMNNPFLGASPGQKLATIFYCLGDYLRLLFFPHPLTNDYYPYHVQLQTFGDPLALGALLVNLALGVLGLWLVFRRKHPVGFAILFYFITISIVSNLLVPVGTFMSERLIFIPSVGFCVAVAWIIIWTGKKLTSVSAEQFLKKNTVGALVLLTLLAGYSFKTITRNPDWKNSLTLFTTDVEVSEGSAKAQNAAGGSLFEKAMTFRDTLIAIESHPGNEANQERLESELRNHLQRSKPHLLRAVEIYLTYSAAWLTLGNVYYYLDHNLDSTIICYRHAGEAYSYRNLEILANELLNTGKFDDAIKSYEELHRVFPEKAEYLVALGRAHGQGKNDLAQATLLLQRALELDPDNQEALKQLGTVHAVNAETIIASNGDLNLAAKEVRTALQYYLRAEKLDPSDPVLMRNIALAYQRLSMTAEYEIYSQKARSLGGM